MAGRLTLTNGRGSTRPRTTLLRASLVATALALASCGGQTGTIATPERIALTYLGTAGRLMLVAPDGRGARSLGAASQALIAPDGARVLATAASTQATTLKLFTGTRHQVARSLARLAAPRWAPNTVRLLGWSADSRYVVLSADEVTGGGEQTALLVANCSSGRIVTVATGNFLGASFSPSLADKLVYSRATVEQLDRGQSLLYETDPGGRATRALTHSGLAYGPAWGPRGIVYAKLLTLGSETRSPLYALWVREPGSAGHRVGDFAAGPPSAIGTAMAISISESGTRIVANLRTPSGKRTSLAIDLTHRRAAARQVTLVGAKVLSATIARSGRALLIRARAANGTSEIVTTTWAGARAHVIAAGSDPSWNG